MQAIQIRCPDTILLSLNESPDVVARDLCLTAAVKFYEMGRLSSGRAAELAGLTRVAFLSKLAEFGVSVSDLSLEELKKDVANA